MYALLISLLVFALMLAGAFAGVTVRPLLLEKHVHPDSREVVKMATGLVGTLAALVLGLLISSAKSSFDQKTGQVRQMTATIILLDDLLGQYGSEATSVRTLLRQSVPPLADRIWHEGAPPAGKPVVFQSTAQSSAFEIQLAGLSPNNDAQRSLQSRAIQAFTEGAQMRLQLFTQTGGSIPTPFLIILIFWLSAIFVSFTLFAEIQFDRHGLPIRLRAVVCGCDLPGLGTGQPLRGADGDFKCDAAERAFALKFCRYWFQLAVIGATAPIHLAGASRGLTAMIKNRFYSWGSKALDGAITASKCCATAGFSAAPRSSISPASTVVPAEGGRVR